MSRPLIDRTVSRKITSAGHPDWIRAKIDSGGIGVNRLCANFCPVTGV